jgi:hypothetical protein
MQIQVPVPARYQPQSTRKWLGSDKVALVVPLFLLMECCNVAAAQGLISSSPALGNTGGMVPRQQVPLLSGTPGAGVKLHHTPTGKPCLTVLGYAHPQVINPNIFDHMISASNDCSQPIKMQLCYYQTQQCISVDIPPYGRKDAVLGIMPAMSQFQFEYREKFDQGSGGFGTGLN